MARKISTTVESAPQNEEEKESQAIEMTPDTEDKPSRCASEEKQEKATPEEVAPTAVAHEKDEEAEPEMETLLFSGMCPLCWTTDIVNPVFLHGSLSKRNSSRDTALVACRECAEKWAPALACHPSEDAVFNCPFCTQALDVASVPQFEALVSGDRLRTMRFCNPITSVDGKPTLFSLAAAKERNSAPCGICEEAGAVTVCVQCDFALCDGCKVATHSKGKFKEHELIPFDSAQKRQRLKCPEHPSHSLDLFCQTCSECVCITCCFGGDAHKGHDVAQLPEVASSVAEGLRGVLHAYRDTAKEAEKVQRKVMALSPSFESCVTKVERDIRESFAALREALTQRETELLTRLHDTHKARRADIDACVALSGCLSAQLTASSESMEKALSEADAVSLLRLRETFTAAAASMDSSTEALLRRVQDAEEGLKSRLDASDGTSSPVASFYLLSPQESSEVAVKKYREVLQTMGQLTTAAQLATSKSTKARPTKARRQTVTPTPVAAAPPKVEPIADEEEHEAEAGAEVRTQPVAPPVSVVKAAPLPALPCLFATAEEAPAPTPKPLPETETDVIERPRSRWLPSLGSGRPVEPEEFRFAPLQSTASARSSLWGAPASYSVSAGPSAEPLSLDIAFGTSRRTEAHTVLSQRTTSPFAQHRDTSFSFSKTQLPAEPPLSATGWDDCLKVGAKRFAVLDTNQEMAFGGFPSKRVRRSRSNEGTTTASEPAHPSTSTSASTLQLRL